MFSPRSKFSTQTIDLHKAYRRPAAHKYAASILS